MLCGAEWIFPVKINAHTCSERKRVKLQLCIFGGRGGGVILGTKRNALATDRRERRLPCFEMCAYFADTGNQKPVKRQKMKGNLVLPARL